MNSRKFLVLWGLLALASGLYGLGGDWQAPPQALETSLLEKRSPGLAQGLIDDFYVLGWNSEGVFAYVTLERDTQGNRQAVFQLQDLVTDEMVKTWRSEMRETQTWEAWWAENLPTLSLHLKAAGIQRVDYQLGYFPISTDGLWYKTYTQGLYTAAGLLKTFVVGLEVPGVGKKIIYTYTGPQLWTAYIAGFIPSDQEKRLAVLVLVQPQGWKGPRGPVRWKVTGVNLKVGFKK